MDKREDLLRIYEAVRKAAVQLEELYSRGQDKTCLEIEVPAILNAVLSTLRQEGPEAAEGEPLTLEALDERLAELEHQFSSARPVLKTVRRTNVLTQPARR